MLSRDDAKQGSSSHQRSDNGRKPSANTSSRRAAGNKGTQGRPTGTRNPERSSASRTPNITSRRGTRQASPQRGTRPVGTRSTGAQPTRNNRNSARRNPQPNPRGNTNRPRSHKKKEPFYVSILRLFVMIFDRKTDADGEVRIRKTQSRVSSSTGIPVFIAFVFFALVVIYFTGYALTMKKTTEVPFDIVQYSTVGSEKKAEGIIIRSEKVFKAATDGNVEYQAAEAEKIKAGAVVCTISTGTDVSKAKTDLAAINSKILEAQSSRMTETKYSDEVKRLNTQIQTISSEGATDFSMGDFSKVYNLKYSIEKKIDSRNQLLLNDNSTDSELTSQRNAQLKALSDGTSAVTSDTGGIVSYFVDGMEDKLTPANLEKLTKEQVSAKPEKVGAMKPDTTKDDAIFKVITSNSWYIASYLPDSYMDGLKQGDTMEIYINNGVEEEPLTVTLQVLKHNEKEAFVVFRSDEYIEDYMDLRNLNFELEKPRSGISIPTSSITQETMLVVPRYYILDNCVQKVNADKTEESVAVEVTGNADKEGYVLVRMQLGKLNVKDKIRLQAGNSTYIINDVVTQDGVFLVNSGVTKFVPINTENSIENEKNTILDPTLNSGLKESDRIAHNARDVRENQGIYE